MATTRPTPPKIYLGQAGWSIASTVKDAFPGSGTHLERYARQLTAVEINSSFYRPHQPKTYAKWAASVPADFRFAVKVPQAITHTARLADYGDALRRFLAEVAQLGPTLGPLLVQLPPSLAFQVQVAQAFFTDLRARFAGAVVCEARHRSWFGGAATQLLADHAVSRVCADPQAGGAVATAIAPGRPDPLLYLRLHGSPEMYKSSYDAQRLAGYAEQIEAAWRQGATCWCIFDNTALGAALPNALLLAAELHTRGLIGTSDQPAATAVAKETVARGPL